MPRRPGHTVKVACAQCGQRGLVSQQTRDDQAVDTLIVTEAECKHGKLGPDKLTCPAMQDALSKGRETLLQSIH
jgi:hypothetical protein